MFVISMCTSRELPNMRAELFVVAVAFLHFGSGQQQLSPILNLDRGQVQGIVQQVGQQWVNFYQGIQYGEFE